MPDRILRAGILTSEPVNALSWPAEVFYRRLMSIVDDYGRYDGRASILRAALYPLKLDRVSEPDVAKWIGECRETGLIRVYVEQSRGYLEVTKFDQRLRAKKSKWPPPGGQMPAHDSGCGPPSVSDSVSVSGNGGAGEREIDLPHGFPPTMDEAIRLAGHCGADPGFVTTLWNSAMAQGGITGNGRPITSWAHYVAKHWPNEVAKRSQARAAGKLDPTKTIEDVVADGDLRRVQQALKKMDREDESRH